MSLLAGARASGQPMTATSAEMSPIFGVSFLVIATKVIRPGHIFRLSVTNYLPQTITSHASIICDGLDIASSEQQCSSNVPEIIMLKVPAQALQGSYKLKVEGRTESDEVIFSNETMLEFDQRSISIFVQTDRPIYRQGQVVKFRTVPITTDLKPFSEALDVYMLDPSGLIVKRWLSKQTNLGSVSLEYPLSNQPVLGNWTIRILAQGQVHDSHFLVEEYHEQQFEVKVSMNSQFLDNDEYINGTISANFTNGAPVSGNLTVVITAELGEQTGSTVENEPKFNGFTEFKYKMYDLRRLLNNRIDNSKVTVSAFVGEPYLDSYQSGFAKAKITSSKVKLKFIGPSVYTFKPYMTFDCYLVASYADGSELARDQLLSSYLEVRLTVMNKYGSALLPNRTYEVTPIGQGTWKITIDIKSQLSKQALLELDHLRVDASLFEYSISRASASIKLYPVHTTSYRSLQITTSTIKAQVGNYAIFHVSSNYKLDIISYIIMSKGLILTSGREKIRSSPTTFAIPISAEMVPFASIMVYDITKGNELVMDVLTFHVGIAPSNNISIILNPNKDKHGESLEVAVYGQPGTYVGLSAFNHDLYALSSGVQLNLINFEQQMQDFNPNFEILMHPWFNLDGTIKNIANFPSTAQGIDVASVLERSGLVIFTDAVIPRRSPSTCGLNLKRCLVVERCYNETIFKCNGRDDCGDSSDESYCDKTDELVLSNSKFKLNRVNRMQRLYEDNWLWKDINIGPLGHYIFTVKLPSLVSTWSVHAFSMSQFQGIGFMGTPLEVTNIRPFQMRLEMPNSCNLGEQIGIRVSITNLMSKEIEVMLSLANSPDYKFVKVKESGQVSSYNPETLSGEHQHLITVKSEETTYVHIPIVASKLGDIKVTVSAVTQAARKVISKNLHVEADGIPQTMHTALVVDLSQGSYLIKHLDTNVSESPVVKYERVRKYIYGSNKVKVSISGGVVGPIVPTIPTDSIDTLRLPSDCGEQNMFNFASNLLMISFLRQTGQESPEVKREVFKHLNLLYQRQLSFRNKDGSFRVFKSSPEPSVWLTAFVARYLHQATAQEWENYIYIDPDVIDTAIEWLVTKQNQEGAFVEQSSFAFDRKLDAGQRSGFIPEDYKLKNVSLTAYVLIALHSLKDRAGEQSVKANNARIMAQKYLESAIHRTTVKTAADPFDLSIITYALQLVNSIEADEAYEYLERHQHQRSGLRYWGFETGPSNQVNTQNNRNIIYPRSRGLFDSRNVQTTAYGLLTQIQRQSPFQRDIVEWLNSQRMSSSGWSSTQDTIVALQSLVEYSINTEHRSVTDIKISLEAPSLRDTFKETSVYITEANISHDHTLVMPNAHGIFTVRAEGSGTAFLSLDVQYNVDWPHLQIQPAVKAFDLDVRPSYSGRNSSSMHLEICARWTLLSESVRSGMAVLEAPVPTGYMISQSILDRIINATSTATLSYPSNLREARVTERKVYFYFDYIDNKRTCVQFTLNRWFPVANLTRFMPVKVYDYYAPERYNETMLNAYNLYALSICHVCGSYQCPYCPFFSSSPTITPSLSVLTFLALLTCWFFLSNENAIKNSK